MISTSDHSEAICSDTFYLKFAPPSPTKEIPMLIFFCFVDTCSSLLRDLSLRKLYVYIGVGWFIYFAGIIFNILYYAVHPSEVDLDEMKPKLHVYILGEVYPCCVGSKEDEKDEQVRDGNRISSAWLTRNN